MNLIKEFFFLLCVIDIFSKYVWAIPLKDKKDTLIANVFYNKENNKESPKFKVSNNVGISKYENTFAKVYFPNWSEEVFSVCQS